MRKGGRKVIKLNCVFHLTGRPAGLPASLEPEVDPLALFRELATLDLLSGLGLPSLRAALSFPMFR